MKYFLIICVLAVFLIFCSNSNSDELNNSGNSNISFETLKKMIQDNNERLANMEDNHKIEKKQQDKCNCNLSNLKTAIKSQTERLNKIEKIESLVKINDISKSFETTLGVLNKNVSEMVKRFEDLEVRFAVIEKTYTKDQKPLETLMTAMEKQKNIISNLEKRLNRQEKMLLSMGKSPKKHEISKETSAVSRKVDTRQIAEMKDHKDIGGKIFIKNVELKTYGKSTNLVAEVINRSDKDYAKVNLKVQLYNNIDTLLDSYDLSILNLSRGSAKKINELLIGVDKDSVAKYEFLIGILKPFSIGDKKATQTTEKKQVVTMIREKQTQIEKNELIKRVNTKIPKELNVFKEISNDLYIRNVTFDKYGTSSTIKGEIKNSSRNDITTASLTMKLIGKNGNVITEFDFHITNIKSNSIKLFEEMASGVMPSQISRYEIKYKKSL